MAVSAGELQEPAFITYLLDPEQTYDCYFLVGNTQLTAPVKIGAVKKMLLAHSMVLRKELQESPLAEKDVVRIEDLYADTFKNLLRYVYGYDIIDVLSFDDVDNLFYAAEKYMVIPLRDRLATRLLSMLSYDNICGLMNNPACYNHLEMNSAITKILQGETGRVLASPQFLELSSDAFLKVVEQDTISVPEIEIWRAALTWAKSRVSSEDGEMLRTQLTRHLRHIRLCSLSTEVVCQEVAQTGVVSDAEVGLICMSVHLRKKQDKLTDICNIIESRSVGNSEPLEEYLPLPSNTCLQSRTVTFVTNKHGIELLPFVFTGRNRQNGVEGNTYQCDCTIVVTRIPNTESEPPITISFSEHIRYATQFQIPITDGGHNVQLLPDSKYTVSVTFTTEPHMMYYINGCSYFSNKHFKVEYFRDNSYYYSPIVKILYRIVDNDFLS